MIGKFVCNDAEVNLFTQIGAWESNSVVIFYTELKIAYIPQFYQSVMG